jgi:hypothetical protein
VGYNRYVTQKIVSENPDPEYYNKELKRVKVKVRKMNSKRKIWAALPDGSQTIIQRVTGSKEEGLGSSFTFGLMKRRRLVDRVL